MGSFLFDESSLAKVPGQGDDTLTQFIFKAKNLDHESIGTYMGWGDHRINDPGVKFVHSNVRGGPDFFTVGSKSAKFIVFNFTGEFVPSPAVSGSVKDVQIAISLTQGVPDTNQNMPHAFYIRFKYYSSADWIDWYGFG